MQKPIIKFIGNIKDLIPMGYKFSKLWARNYKAYIKHGIIIWVAGKEVGIKDLSLTNSAKVAHLIVNDKYPVYEKDVRGLVHFNRGDPKLSILNEKTGEITEWMQFLKNRGCKSLEDVYNYDHDIYRDLILSRDLLDTVKELHTKKMINISI